MATATGASYELTPSQLINVVKVTLKAGRRPMIWGAPGVGKSESMMAVADDLAMRYVDIRPSSLDPVDIHGIPYVGEDRHTHWALPSFLPPMDSEDAYLINLEELPNAPPSMQVALYQLVQYRSIGDYTLPANAHIVACGNREQDRSGTHRMLPTLASRFFHYDVRPDLHEWLSWGAQKGLAWQVLFFLRVRGEDLLNVFNPQSKELAFPCPRTWEYASDALGVMPADIGNTEERAIYRGVVGEAAAIEFTAFLKICRELPHPDTIIRDPAHAPIPDNASVLLALCGSLYREADDTTFDAIIIYAERLRAEVGEFLVGQCLTREPKLQYTQAWQKWISTRRPRAKAA